MYAVSNQLIACTAMQKAQAAGPNRRFCHGAKALATQHRAGNLMADPVLRHAAGTAVHMLLSTGAICQEGSAQYTADVGLLPVRQRRHQVLMDALVGGERSDPASLFGSPRTSSQSPSPERGEECYHVSQQTHCLHICFQFSSWFIVRTKSRSRLCRVSGTLVTVSQAKVLAALSQKAMTKPLTCCKLIACHAPHCCDTYASDGWLQSIYTLL